MDFARSGFAQLLASSAGRLARIVAGLALIAWGYFAIASPLGVVLVAVGLIPLAAGVFDFCILSPALGGPFWGASIRSAVRQP